MYVCVYMCIENNISIGTYKDPLTFHTTLTHAHTQVYTSQVKLHPEGRIPKP